MCELGDKETSVGERSHNGFVPVSGARQMAVGLYMYVTGLA